jgi:hypothetical protein
MPLWKRQVIDAFDAGEKKHGKLAKAPRRKDKTKKAAIKDKTQKLDALVQEKAKELAPRGEWRKYISDILNEYMKGYSPSQSAIYAFITGYTWQKYRKTWVTRDINHKLNQQVTTERCMTKWMYEVESLLEANLTTKGELPQPKIVKKRGGKLDQALIDKFYDAIPDVPAEVVPDKEWQDAFSAFFNQQFHEHTMFPACWTAFAAGAAWYEYRDVLDQ